MTIPTWPRSFGFVTLFIYTNPLLDQASRLVLTYTSISLAKINYGFPLADL